MWLTQDRIDLDGEKNNLFSCWFEGIAIDKKVKKAILLIKQYEKILLDKKNMSKYPNHSI